MNRDKLLRQWLPEGISLNPIGDNGEKIWIEEFEEIYRTFAYNHIIAEEAGGSRMGCHEACDALYNLTALIDGLKGKNLQA